MGVCEWESVIAASGGKAEFLVCIMIKPQEQQRGLELHEDLMSRYIRALRYEERVGRKCSDLQPQCKNTAGEIPHSVF